MRLGDEEDDEHDARMRMEKRMKEDESADLVSLGLLLRNEELGGNVVDFAALVDEDLSRH